MRLSYVVKERMETSGNEILMKFEILAPLAKTNGEIRMK